jgi:hypothetical protein
MKTLQLNTRNAKQGDEVIISSGKALRHQDYWSGKAFRLIPSGIRTEHWYDNPAMLYQHDSNIPLGTADIFHENGMLKARDIVFHRKRVPTRAGEFDTGLIADLWEEGWINAVSNHIMLTKEDIERVLETEEEIIIPTSEMLEFSIVTLPADRDAVRKRAMEMGVSDTIAASLFNPTAVTRDSGIIEVVTQSATAHSDGATVTEDIMEHDELEMETQDTEAQEAPPVDGPDELETAVQVEDVEEVIELSAEELVNALVETPEAIQALAQAVVEAILNDMPDAVNALASAVAPPTRQTRLVINTNKTRPAQAQPQAQAQPNPHIAASVQPSPAPQRIKNEEGEKPKKYKLTGMVRPQV